MTPQDATTIRDVFAKIRGMGLAVDDPEAARLVAQELAGNPAAALNLVKVVVGLEQERDQFAAHIDELNAYIDQIEEQLRAYGHGQPQPQSGGLFGGSTQGTPWDRGPAPGQVDPRLPQAQPAPWGGQPQPAPWGGGQPQAQPGPWGAPQPQGSSFWGSALRTGAGVAGGLFAFEAMKGLFGGGHGAEAREHAPRGLFDGDREAPRSGEAEAPRGGEREASSGGFGGESSGPAPGSFVADNIDFFGGGSDDRDA